MSQLLKSAIADAKAVRATALANAKAALEEMFQPKLQSMMAAKLQQEIEGEDENPDEVPVADAPVTDDVPVEDAAPEVPFGDAPVGDSAPTETPAADIGGLGSDDASAEIPNNDEEIEEYGEGNIDPVEQSTDLTEESDAGYKKMTTGHKTEDPQGAKLVVKKLEGTKGEPKAQGEPKSAKAGAKTKDPQGPSDELASGPKKGEKNSTGNVLEEDDGEVSDDTLDEILAELEAEVSAVNTDATEEAPAAEVAPVAPAVSDEEEIDLDELLSEEKDEDEDDKDEDKEEKNDDDDDADDDKKKNLPPWLQKENLALKKELQEYRKAVSFLRDRINEVNLLNAKLLYTNRLFKAASLTKEEKLKVIESFDLTKSVREAKLVYATLSESFSFGGKKALASKAVVKSITEGLASKPVASTKPTAIATARPELLSEGAAMAARFQKLAGITK